jgi:exopolyphosphatase/guanosine-5'-triphosphate,3'-diphosphate pyrophosphatase
MRTAVVDIGTNSTRLLIAELNDGRVTDERYRASTVTRLGAGVDADGRLHPDSIARTHAVLDEYKAKIDGLQADRRLAVLTSAVRDAANGQEFARGIETRYGLETHIIAGEEEARLTFLGATSERDPADTEPTLVLDIGGGSTEFVIGHGREVDLHDDPPTQDQLKAMRTDVDQIIRAGIPEPKRTAVTHAIAVAGTATSLAAIAQELDPYDPDKVHGYLLTTDEVNELHERIAKLTLQERRQLKGLDPARAPTIVAGTVIMTEVLALFGLSRVEVSEHDILRGAALGL